MAVPIFKALLSLISHNHSTEQMYMAMDSSVITKQAKDYFTVALCSFVDHIVPSSVLSIVNENMGNHMMWIDCKCFVSKLNFECHLNIVYLELTQ